MKDAFGHGSNGNGLASQLRNRLQQNARQFGGQSYAKADGAVSSNAEAANALFSTLKSTMVPIHDAMAGRASNPTSGRSPAEFDRLVTQARGKDFAGRNGLK